MPDLLPFGSVCAACCNSESSVRFCALTCEDGAIPFTYEPHDRLGMAAWPHLHRVCARCGYTWLERCLGIAADESGKQARESVYKPVSVSFDATMTLAIMTGVCHSDPAHGTRYLIHLSVSAGDRAPIATFKCSVCGSEWTTIAKVTG